MSKDVIDHVKSIVEILENPPLLDEMDKYDLGYEEQDEAYLSAYDYLSTVLDVVHYVTDDRDYLGTRVMVAFGGPTIWVDTYKRTVEGQWWGDTFTGSFDDAIGLTEACEDMYNSY